MSVYLMIQNNTRHGLFGRHPWSSPMSTRPDTMLVPPPAPAQNKASDPDRRAAPVAPRRLLPDDSAGRKLFPLITGFLDYFPDAAAAVAEISFKGNQKHNPGQELHWARGKSMDHADCMGRHLIERGHFDAEGNRHSAQLAWRAMAALQEELEAEKQLSSPRGAKILPPR